MMLQKVPDLAERFADEAARIQAMGFQAMKMKVGLGPKQDIKLVETVRGAIHPDTRLMVDANDGGGAGAGRDRGGAGSGVSGAVPG